MERVIYSRLLPIVESNNGLSERQYGFRCVINMIMNLSMGALVSGGCCAVLALDVKNPFDFAN